MRTLEVRQRRLVEIVQQSRGAAASLPVDRRSPARARPTATARRSALGLLHAGAQSCRLRPLDRSVPARAPAGRLRPLGWCLCLLSACTTLDDRLRTMWLGLPPVRVLRESLRPLELLALQDLLCSRQLPLAARRWGVGLSCRWWLTGWRRHRAGGVGGSGRFRCGRRVQLAEGLFQGHRCRDTLLHLVELRQLVDDRSMHVACQPRAELALRCLGLVIIQPRREPRYRGARCMQRRQPRPCHRVRHYHRLKRDHAHDREHHRCADGAPLLSLVDVHLVRKLKGPVLRSGCRRLGEIPVLSGADRVLPFPLPFGGFLTHHK